MSPPGRLTIDLDALCDNWRRLAREVAPAACGAVIKANAYGIGIENAAPALWRAGCRIFFVAHVGEGARARAALGDDARVYVLNGFEAGAEVGDYAAAGLSPVIGAAAELARWDRSRPFALHFDTGMNRLGFPPADVDPAKMAGAALVMSHLVSAEIPDDPVNARQIAAFERLRALFPGVSASLANSSGVFLPAKPHYDLVRPGYALYGGNPTPGRENPMRPVVTLEIAVQQTRWIEPGETCGYNGRWTARRRTRLATLPAGYADGLPFGAGATDAGAGRGGAHRRPHVPAGRAHLDGPVHRRRDLSPGFGGGAGNEGRVLRAERLARHLRGQVRDDRLHGADGAWRQVREGGEGRVGRPAPGLSGVPEFQGLGRHFLQPRGAGRDRFRYS